MVDNKLRTVHALRMKRDPTSRAEYIPMANDLLDDNETEDTLTQEELLIEDDDSNLSYFEDFWSGDLSTQLDMQPNVYEDNLW